MLTNGQKHIKLLAHFTVQKELASQLEYEYAHSNKTELQLRKILLKQLEYHGYSRFLLNENHHLDPVYSAMRQSEEDGGWYHDCVFNVIEIQAYLNYVQDSSTVLEFAEETWGDARGNYGGPGRPFRNSTDVAQKRNRIVVYASGGIDC